MQTASHHGHLPNTKGFAHPARNVEMLDIQPGMQVADFGAGSGAYVLAIAERLQGEGRIYAIDVQKDLLRRIHNECARRGYRNADVVWADLEKPHASRIKAGSIDLVLISNVLFQLEDKAAVFAEAKRVLHGGGRLVVIDWSDSYRGMGPHKKSVVTQEQAVSIAHQSGFEVLREFAAGAHHWGVVLRLSGGGARKIGIRS